MERIAQLADNVINKIAAGEVVECPASIVKELVENSLDAGASRIDIEVTGGGRDGITVSDNGSGIACDQLPLAITRHATSKITSADDLFHIQTQGFRGEALASMAAVSHLTLQSRQHSEVQGGLIEVHGGHLKRQVPWDGPAGTVVSIRDLFFNVPARKHFLRSDAAEWADCLEWVQSMSLAHPAVTFSLVHNGREKFRSPAVPNSMAPLQALRQRLKAVLKDDVSDKLLEIEADPHSWGRWRGLVSPPGLDVRHTRCIWLYVNGRWVHDKGIRWGIQRAYTGHLMSGRFPICAFMLTCDPSLVDVNVHPAKTEVRLQYREAIVSQIGHDIRAVLRHGDWAHPNDYRMAADPAKISDNADPKYPENGTISRHSGSVWGSRQLLELAHQANPKKNWTLRHERSVASPPPYEKSPLLSGGGKDRDDPTPSRVRPGIFPEDQAQKQSPGMPVAWVDVRFIGQCQNLYLMFDHPMGLLVVDQHAFHERILYERLLSQPNILGQSQPMLVPEGIALRPSQIEWIREQSELLHRLGFMWDVLNDDLVEIKGIPSLLLGRDVARILQDLIDWGVSTTELAQEGLMHHALATMACHSAVRAGEAMEEIQVQALLQEAQQVDFSLNCPHGRPTFKWWPKNQLGLWFDR